MSAQIAEKVEQLAVAVNSAQEANTIAINEISEKSDKSFENHEICLKETQKKAAEDATKVMQEIQDVNLRMKGLEEHHNFLEKQFSRLPANEGDVSDFEKRARDGIIGYLRRGTRISDDIVKEVCSDVARKAMIASSDEDIELYTKTLIAGNNPQGGYFIRPERSATMIQRIFETSPVRSFATVTTTNSDTLEFVIDDNEATSGGWVGEVSPRGNTNTPDIGLETIPVHEQFAQPKATQKMLDDAGFDIEAWLSRKITDKMTRDENTAFVLGDGSQKPKGFMSYPAWSTNGLYERYAVEQITGLNATSATPFDGDDFKNIQNAVIEEYQANAVWLLKRATFSFVITLKDNDDRYIFNSRFLNERDPMVLLGKQVVFMNDMAEIPTTGFPQTVLPVAYGDFSLGYTVVDRLGFRVIRDEFTDKPFIKFYTTKRTGGAATNFQSYKILAVALTS